MSAPPFNGDTPFAQVREYLAVNADDGVDCPCCSRRVKIYRRSINAGMARALIAMYRHGCTDWLHKPTALRGLGAAARDESLLRFWGLIEEASERRDDGGRAGWWRVTDAGEQYANGLLRVPKYARIYNGRCLGLTGDPVGIRDALGARFDLAKLLAGTA